MILYLQTETMPNSQRANSTPDGLPMKGGRRFSCPPAYAVENAVMIKRAPFTQAAFDELHLKSDDDDKQTFRQKLMSKCQCTKQKVWKIFSGYLPLIKVLRYYNIREFLPIDIISGITIGILHIPQALAFGLLTSVKVENGLYTSVWPVVLYVLFGTSAHVSMGTSAVICIVTAAVVDRQADEFKIVNAHLMSNHSGNGTLEWTDIPEFMDFKEQTAMGITFFTGAILIAMGLLKLGFITAYLSDSFFSAFTSGAGVHIATSQIPAIFGLKVARYAGVGKIIKTYGAIFSVILETNIASLITAILSAIAILFVKDCINERFKHKLPIPIPIELFVVIVACLVSYFANMADNFGVNIVGTIPNTIPAPVLPSFDGVGTYMVDCFVLAILIFANTIAMAKICAKRHNYEVDDSQELIAYGMCNLGSSFLRCFPSSVAPPRSMVASSMGTKTTLCGIFSSALLILLILVMSTLFEPLPKSALAAIIVVSLKGLFIQLKDCVKFWKVNKIDFVIWFFTLVSVVFLDIDFGLGIGVVVSLITVVFQAQFARGYRVGRTMKDIAMVEHKKYIDSIEVSGIKVYRFHSNLFFANAEIFRMALYRATVNPRKLLKFIKKQERKAAKEDKNGKVPEDNQYDNKLDISVIKENGSNGNVHNGGVTQDKKDDLANKRLSLPVITVIPTNANNNGHQAFSRLDSTSSVGSARSLQGEDNPVFLMKDELGMGMAQLDVPGNYDLYKRNMSVTTLTTLGDDEQEDPEDGQEVVTEDKIRRMRRIHHVILDFSTVNYMDISGANVISHISKEYDHVNIKLFLANISADVRHTMEQAGVFDVIPKERVFIHIIDAIAVAKLEMVLPIPVTLEDFTFEEAEEDKYVTNM